MDACKELMGFSTTNKLRTTALDEVDPLESVIHKIIVYIQPPDHRVAKYSEKISVRFL